MAVNYNLQSLAWEADKLFMGLGENQVEFINARYLIRIVVGGIKLMSEITLSYARLGYGI